MSFPTRSTRSPEPTWRTVNYGRERLTYELTFADTAAFTLTVAPDGAVRARAPAGADPARVDERVRDRGRWVLKQRRAMAERARRAEPAGPFEYVSGETHRYLGRRYRLRVRPPAPGERPGVTLAGAFFEVRAAGGPTPARAARVRRLLTTWYRRRAAAIFAAAVAEALTARPLRDVPPPPVSLRTMRRRWGSCTAAGRVLLHPDLVRAPRACVEYVVAHELCHLIERRHGPAFYRLLTAVLPDWRERREALAPIAPPAPPREPAP